MSDPAPIHSIDLTGGQPAPAGAPTMLDRLWEYIDQEVALPPVTIVVPMRPKVAVRFGTEIDDDLYRQWFKRATVRNELDAQKLAITVITNKCEAILFDGVEATDDGEPLTFASPAFQRGLGAVSTADAVRKFYVRDADIKTTATKIIEEAGYFDEAETADPTQT